MLMFMLNLNLVMLVLLQLMFVLVLVHRHFHRNRGGNRHVDVDIHRVRFGNRHGYGVGLHHLYLLHLADSRSCCIDMRVLLLRLGVLVETHVDMIDRLVLELVLLLMFRRRRVHVGNVRHFRSLQRGHAVGIVMLLLGMMPIENIHWFVLLFL